MGLLSSLFKKESKPLKINPNESFACPSVTILYGTKTGNAQLVAQQTQKSFEQNGIDSECYNISKYNISRLFSEKLLLIVMSTDGEGEFPPNSRKFFSQLSNAEFPALAQLNYSICALGDSSYEHYCGAGKQLDKRLQTLGAKAVIPRIDCDLEFRETALSWIEKVFSHLRSEDVSSDAKDQALPEIQIDAHDMLQSKLLKRYAVSKGDAGSAVYHIILDNSQTKIAYEAGDCIEIIPENPETLVDQIIKTLGIDSDIHINGSGFAIRDLLKYKYELTKVSRPLVKKYQALTNHEELLRLVNNKEELKAYANRADVLDLIKDFPASINGEQLTSILSPLHSRYYSIASGSKAYPEEIHLCIKTVRFEANARKYEGAGSVFMNEGLAENTRVNFRHIPNASFHLPEDNNTPIILIGVGTGIAPYRAFLNDRKAQNILDQTWLIWGDKEKEKDFLYEDELNTYQKEGYLHRLDTAFSRDQAEKIYVQDVFIRNKSEILNWIENGAHIYLCGHTKMGHSVRNTLSDLLIEHKSISKEEANNEVLKLIENGRLHEDLY
ncbi:diflavin oxidoreductase [Carboxylicivirga sp. N1Y90]|uniref:diflavin oxidoreductase n=1 Tax=Carboxylicivirga fragile TaxID=3417571 RepID=UPI003D341306|nr:flavodoxin domain-containing protein [Marinilabiliaceae bacterium N1Y90]